MNKIKLIGVSGVTMFLLFFVYFGILLALGDSRVSDDHLELSEMLLSEKILFFYAGVASGVSWLYGTIKAFGNGHSRWGVAVFMIWPLSAWYLYRYVR